MPLMSIGRAAGPGESLSQCCCCDMLSGRIHGVHFSWIGGDVPAEDWP